MARLIVYNDYLSSKCDRAHILDSLDYISHREGVELNDVKMKRMLDPAAASRCMTAAQEDLISSILDAYPDMKQQLQYEEFSKEQNMYTASRFISESIESLEELASSNEIYARYIANRPGVVKNEHCDHGLFDASGDADFKAVEKELKEHEGNVWRSIISLRRTDAAELDMEDQKAWRDMIMKHIPALAKDMGILYDNFRWCASFHNESYHPHLHMMYWSTEDRGFCTRETIEHLKQNIIHDIYANEIWLHQEYKTEIRDELESLFKKNIDSEYYEKTNKAVKECMCNLPDEIHPDLMMLSSMISRNGSQKYQYQQPDVKKQTDLITAKIFAHPSFAPILEEYIKAQMNIAEFYRSDDSQHMKKYLNDFIDGLIHPGRNERKVLHNQILKSAYGIRQQLFEKRMASDPKFFQLKELITTGATPVYGNHAPSKLAGSIMKFSMYFDHDPDRALAAAASILPDEDKRMELFLELRSGNSDIMQKNSLNEKDMNFLYQAFQLNDTSEYEPYIPVDHTMYDCTRMIQQFISIISSDTSQNHRELQRLKRAHREDEAAALKMRSRENKRSRK